jgi:hypothetical protein
MSPVESELLQAPHWALPPYKACTLEIVIQKIEAEAVLQAH